LRLSFDLRPQKELIGRPRTLPAFGPNPTVVSVRSKLGAWWRSPRIQAHWHMRPIREVCELFPRDILLVSYRHASPAHNSGAVVLL
jgi:hypothetical protein